MNAEQWRSWLQDRLRAADPNADVERGSALDIEVIQPIVSRVGPDVATVGEVQYVLSRLRQARGGEGIGVGDALVDMAVHPLGHILAPLHMEIRRMASSLSLADPRRLDEESADALLANFLLSREEGTHTVGTVRLFFASPQSITVHPTYRVLSVRGDVFFPIATQTISQTDMFLQRLGILYYVDIQVQSAEPGAVRIEQDEILQIEGLEGVVRVSNPSAFAQGRPRESVEAFVEQARIRLSERTLVSARGAVALVRDQFPSLYAISIAGHSDPEMIRDLMHVIESGAPATIRADQPLAFPVALVAGVSDRLKIEVDDGAGGSDVPRLLTLAGVYPTGAHLCFAINSAWQTAGGTGSLASMRGTHLELRSGTDVPSSTLPASASRLRLVTLSTRGAYAALGFAGSQLDVAVQGLAGAVVTQMPGGILRPTTPLGLELSPEAIHLGGCTDIYASDSDRVARSSEYTATEGHTLAWSGQRLRTHPVLPLSDRVRDPSIAVRTGSVDFTLPRLLSALDRPSSRDVALGVTVRQGDILRIREGASAGFWTLASTPNEEAGLAVTDLRTSTLLASSVEGELSYHLYTHASIRLDAPRQVVKVSGLHGTHLQLYAGSRLALWLSPALGGIDSNLFGDYGVAVGDVLEVLSRANGHPATSVGRYTITSVASTSVEVDRPFEETERVLFSIMAEAGEAIRRPFLSLSSVHVRVGNERLEVPYALPVSVQSRGLSGARVKRSGSNGIVTGASPLLLAVPTGRSLLLGGIVAGDVVVIEHPSIFGIDTARHLRRVVSVTALTMTLDAPLPLDPGDTANDVFFSVGSPARGFVRLAMLSRVDFEMQTGSVTLTPDVLSYTTSTPSLAFEDEGGTRFTLPARELLGEMHLYPSPRAGEDARTSMVDRRRIPTVASDLTRVDETGWVVSSSDVQFRSLLLRPTSPDVLGDVFHVYAERNLGFGSASAPVTTADRKTDAFLRLSWSVARLSDRSANRYVYPFGSFNTSLAYTVKGLTDDPMTAASIEGAWGQMEDGLVLVDSLDATLPSPNIGTYRVEKAVLEDDFSRSIDVRGEQSVRLSSTDVWTEECGSSYDGQTTIVTTGVGAYLDGEYVVNGAIRMRVTYYVAATGHLHLEGEVPFALWPANASVWTGETSGTARVQSSRLPFRGLLPQDGTATCLFANTTAPGWVSSSKPGPWVPGRTVSLFGSITNAAGHAEAVVGLMSTWIIDNLSVDGQTLTLVHPEEAGRVFDTAGLPVEVAWCISQGLRPVERVRVFEDVPETFALSEVVYERLASVPASEALLLDPTLQADRVGRSFLTVENMPYVIARPGRIAIAREEWEEEGGLFVADVEVESSTPYEESNLGAEVDLVIASAPCPHRGAWIAEDGSYKGEGYVLSTDDEATTLTAREVSYVVASPRIRPASRPATPDSRLVVVGGTWEIAYEHAPQVESLDTALTEGIDRVVAASLLARHSPPFRLYTSIRYSGTPTPDQLFATIRDYLERLPVQEPLDVSDIERLLHSYAITFAEQGIVLSGVLVLPDRRLRAVRSATRIGGGATPWILRPGSIRVASRLIGRLDLRRTV